MAFSIARQLTAEERVQKCVVDIMNKDRYIALAGLLVMGNREVRDDMPTAATNGRDEYYGRAFVEGLTDPELRYVVIHENYHKLYRHLHTWKHLHDKDHRCANMACDYVINLPIQDRYHRDQFVKLPDGGCVDEKYRDMDAGEVFKLLKQDNKHNKPKGFDQHDWDGAAKLTDKEAEELSKAVDQALRQGNIVCKQGRCER